MNDRYEAGRHLEVWFSGKLDKRTGKVIAAYTGRREERNAVSKGSESSKLTTWFTFQLLGYR